MGLSNASQMFQRAMEIVLKGLIGTMCLIYIDDIVVFSRSEEEHVTHLQTLFARLQQYNLRLNPSKCVFGLRQVKLLGYVVSQSGLSADPDKVAAIDRLQPPKTVAEVRTFLGMTGYYRTCIKNYAHIAEPLVQLTRKNIKFVWTDSQQQAFNSLKAALMSDTVMAHPDPEKPYLLYTDACDYAIGAILCQVDAQGIERPVVYLSKQLSQQQRKWATIEKEAYAVVYALGQLRPYLWCAEYRTFTDHKPLTCLFTKSMNNTKIQRWAIMLSEYNCKVEYHKGKLNVRADMLSRIKQEETINTFDSEYWHIGDPLPDLPEDDPLPDIYNLDLKQIAQQQQLMPEWLDQHEDDSDYTVINGLLYSIKRPYRYATDHPRLVIPPQHRPVVIDIAHREVGHMSVVKTMRKIQSTFAWPHMKRDVTDYIKKCPTCITHSKVIPRHPMGEMPLATSPAQIVAADLIGPLVKSTDNNQFILTIIDHCTGWAEAYPIPNKSSQEVWKQMTRHYFPRHGYPHVLLTDQGLEFNATAFTDYLRAVGIHHRKCTPYNPQANGKTEKFNGTLKAIISKQINNNRASWEDQLAPALMAYNNSVSEATSHTPFFLHHARRARLPITRLLRPPNLLDNRLEDISSALRASITETFNARKYNRERLAKQANQGTINVGDTVVVKAQEPLSLTTKWDPQWTVTAVNNKVVTLIHQQSSKKKILNANKVRVVDPNIVWDDMNPRPIRNARVSTKTTGLHAQNPQMMLHIPAPPPRDTQQSRAPAAKRKRADHAPPASPTSTSMDPDGNPNTDVQPLMRSLAPQKHSQTQQSTHPQKQPQTHRINQQRTPAVTRTAPQPLENVKRPHRAGTKRAPHPATAASHKRPALNNREPLVRVSAPTRFANHFNNSRYSNKSASPVQQAASQRTRPFLPRGTKRSLLTNIRKPSPLQQKRLRIEIIELVKHISQC